MVRQPLLALLLMASSIWRLSAYRVSSSTLGGLSVEEADCADIASACDAQQWGSCRDECESVSTLTDETESKSAVCRNQKGKCQKFQQEKCAKTCAFIDVMEATDKAAVCGAIHGVCNTFQRHICEGVSDVCQKDDAAWTSVEEEKQLHAICRNVRGTCQKFHQQKCPATCAWMVENPPSLMQSSDCSAISSACDADQWGSCRAECEAVADLKDETEMHSAICRNQKGKCQKFQQEKCAKTCALIDVVEATDKPAVCGAIHGVCNTYQRKVCEGISDVCEKDDTAWSSVREEAKLHAVCRNVKGTCQKFHQQKCPATCAWMVENPSS